MVVSEPNLTNARGAKGYGGERGWRKRMVDKIGQERRMQYAWVLGMYLYLLCLWSAGGRCLVIHRL